MTLGDALTRLLLIFGILVLLGITIIYLIKFIGICRKWRLLREIKKNGNNRDFISKIIEQSRDKNTKHELKWLKGLLSEAREKDRAEKREMEMKR